MSMLEKMARRLAQDALERVQPGIYTSVVDGISLYQMLDGNYQVGERLGAGDEDAPGISYETVRETMVAMMAAEAGALVVVPEDTPGDPYLAQIAQLLVDSGDVPIDAQDVANGAAIVLAVKNALDWLTTARREAGNLRGANLQMCKHLDAINALLAESPDVPLTKDDLQVWAQTVAGVTDALRYLNEARGNCVANEHKVERLNNQIQTWNTGANELQDKYLAAQQEIGALTEQLSAAKRTAKRWEDEAANSQARYEGMEAALRIVLELAGVGK